MIYESVEHIDKLKKETNLTKNITLVFEILIKLGYNIKCTQLQQECQRKQTNKKKLFHILLLVFVL